MPTLDQNADLQLDADLRNTEQTYFTVLRLPFDNSGLQGPLATALSWSPMSHSTY